MNGIGGQSVKQDNFEVIAKKQVCKQIRFHSKIGDKMVEKDKFDAFTAAVTKNQYDIDAWHGLLRCIQAEQIDDFRENVYEKLIEAFPTSGKFWKHYIEHEVRNTRDFPRKL